MENNKEITPSQYFDSWILDNLFGNDDDKGYNLFNLR